MSLPGRMTERLYRAALRLLPAPIRRKHGDAMVALFRRQLERARDRGRGAWLRAGGAGLIDVVGRALYERVRPSPEHGGGSVLSSLAQDVRYAFRTLRRSPRFTVLAVLTLALGIGANSALFSVVYGVVLRPLPFPDAERVTHLGWDRGGPPRGAVPAYKVEYWSEHTEAFEAVTTWRSTSVELGEDGSGDAVGALRVTSAFLDVVGWEPVLGRGFTEADDRPGAPDVALLGHGLWRTRFGGDRDVLGRTLQVDGRPHTVVGVLPADFTFPQAPDRDGVLLPLRLQADPRDEGENWEVLARLAPGVDRTAAQVDLDRVYRSFEAEHPELMNGTDRAMVLASFQEIHVGDTRTTLWILLGATGLVLLISCANVAALLLARGSSRGTELAVRTALGAGRGRIVRQILAESLILATAAAVAGLALAHVGVRALLGLYPGTLPRSEWIGLDGTVGAYAALAALVTGLVFGVAAAVPAIRRDVAGTLRDETRGASRRGRLRQLLVGAESAVALVLLVGAGLLVATLSEIRGVDPGFEADGVVSAPLPAVVEAPSIPGGGLAAGADAPVPPAGSMAERVRAAEATLERLRSIPGVEGVALTSTLPLERGLNIPVGLQGRPEEFEGAVEWRAVSPGYLETLEIDLVRGRNLSPSDDAGAPPVALVNQAFVDRWFPGEDPLGRRIQIGRYRDRYVHPSFDVGGVEVVGVVADVREISLKQDARRTVLVPAAQVPEVLSFTPIVLARVEDPAATTAIRAELAATAGGGPPPTLRRLEDVLSQSVAPERFNALLMATFAVVAVLLTAFGIYGVVSYTVRQRKREIGIRMALGAGRRTVARLVVGQGMLPVVIGLILGAGAALALGRLISSLLWGVTPTDPVTLGGAALFLTGVALLSSWIPVWEATGIDPGVSLQPE